MKKLLLLLSLFLIFSCNQIQQKQEIPTQNLTEESVSVNIPEQEEVLTYADIMPNFVGGEHKLFDYIKENIKYPDSAKVNGIEGTVYVQFIVLKTGDISDVKVLKSADILLDSEAFRVISEMPKWTPGYMSGGKAVNVQIVLPIKFQLN